MLMRVLKRSTYAIEPEKLGDMDQGGIIGNRRKIPGYSAVTLRKQTWEDKALNLCVRFFIKQTHGDVVVSGEDDR